MEEPGGEVERRQQDLERLLGIAPHDEQRQHVLEHQDEDRHEQQQHPDRRKTLGPGEHGEHDRGEREDEAEHQPRRHEELDGIVEVEPETVVAPAALDHQPQRQAHQGAEGRFDRAHVDGGEREQQQECDHALARRAAGRADARSISPDASPPLRRSVSSDARHAAVVIAIVVVVAEQVQQPMQREHPQLGLIRMPGLFRLTSRDAVAITMSPTIDTPEAPAARARREAPREAATP